MNKRYFLGLAVATVAGVPALAQAKAGGALQAPVPNAPRASFQPALPGFKLAFPRDHAAHPAFKTEWWYYTGNLKAQDGRAFGYQLTFFRVGVPASKPQGPKTSAWRAADVHLAHFAITDVAGKAFTFNERLQRGAGGLAWAATDRYEVVNGTWSARLFGTTHRLAARAGQQAIALSLDPVKPPVLHGRAGLSKKSGCETCASHYYSLSRMRTSGTLHVGGQELPVTGESWMDHEFGSNQLAEDEAGWDWYSLQLDDGTELMLYRLRKHDDTVEQESSGTFVAADGRATHLTKDQAQLETTGRWLSKASRALYPMGWKVAVPSQQLELTVSPVLEDQELRTRASADEVYWEGAVQVTGKRAGRAVKGHGYVEMTGYAAAFKARI